MRGFIPSLLLREYGIEHLEGRGIVHGIDFAVEHPPALARQSSGIEFERHHRRSKTAVGKSQAVTFGAAESEAAVVARITHDAYYAISQLAGFGERRANQCATDALHLKFGQHTQRPEDKRRGARTIIVQDIGVSIGYMSDNAAVNLGDKAQLGDKVGRLAQAVQHEMLVAARHIDVPKCFAGKLFDTTKVIGTFCTDSYFCGSIHDSQFFLIVCRNIPAQ